MSRFIVDTALNEQIPISALIAVSPGLSRALTPWYVTKNAQRKIDCNLSPPLKLHQFTVLHKNSPLTFQYATSLSIEIENEQEMNELLSSDAAKSLFRQTHTLYLRAPTIYNPQTLLAFVQQFGLLKHLKLSLGPESKCRTQRQTIFDFFCEALSSPNVTRNEPLTLSTLCSFVLWYAHLDNNSGVDHNRFVAQQEGRLLPLIITCMINAHSKDDGTTSFVSFLDCIAEICVQANDMEACFSVIVPLLDFIETILLNGDFKKIALRSHGVKLAGMQLTEFDQIEVEATSLILDILERVLNAKNVALRFIHRYGHSLLREFSRVIFDSRKNQDDQVYDYFEKIDETKIKAFRTVNERIFRSISSACDNIVMMILEKAHGDLFMTESEASHFVLTVFPLEGLCGFIENHAISGASALEVIQVLPHLELPLQESGMPLNDRDKHLCCDLAKKLFYYIRYLNNRKFRTEFVLEALVDLLKHLLFGFYTTNNERCSDIRRSFFENPKMIEELLDWGRKVADDFELESNDVDQVMLKDKLKVYNARNPYMSTLRWFASDYVCPLLQMAVKCSAESGSATAASNAIVANKLKKIISDTERIHRKFSQQLSDLQNEIKMKKK